MRRALLAAATLMALAPPAGAATPERGDFDTRARGEQRAGGAALRERLGRFGLVAADPRTGTPRAVARLDGFLTGAGDRPGSEVALGYVRDHAGVFGLDGGDVERLRLVRRVRAGGVEHLTWEQRYRGIPSADTELRAAVTASGRLLSVTGAPAADLAVGSVEPAVSAERAYAAVRGATIAVERRAGGAEQATAFADGGRASLVLYQAGDGTRLGWRVLAPRSSTEVYDAIVDARGGTVVRRSNRVDFAGAAKIFRSNPRDTPQEDFTFPDAWLAPGATTLKGPFAHAFVDPNDQFGPGSLTPPLQNEVGVWIEPLETVAPGPGAGCTPAAPCTWVEGAETTWIARNRNQSATQLFYLVNTFRDHLAQAPIGFDGFRDADRVLAQAMDGAALRDEDHLNNASFLTLPDGEPALLQVHLFSDGGHYDGANDASLAFHEYTHGLSNRLVTDAQGFGALSTAQAGAIGEGTSDFYALDYLVDEGLTADGAGADVRLATYLNDPEGLRLQAIDTPAATGANFAEFGDGGAEVHDDGEIWAQTLWDLRTLLGVGPARAVITEAMRLSPPEPSFLDMRNAILLAHAGDDGPLWDVFRARGMGYFASTDGSSDVAPIADAGAPPAAGDEGVVRGTVMDDDGQPLAGAHVGIAGHDTQGRGGLGPELAGDTGLGGGYEFAAPAGEYPLMISRRAGHRDARAVDVLVADGSPVTVDFTLVRDWSSAANGATVERFTGPDNSASGCGPGGLIDDRLDAVWGSEQTAAGQTIVIDLGAPVDVAGVAIDPAAGCGDEVPAALRDYEVSGATGPDGDFRPLGLPGAFDAADGGALRDLAGAAAARVRYVRLHAKTAQITFPAGSGLGFLDVAELHVAKTPGSALGPSVDTGTAQGVGATAAGLTGTVTPRGAPAQVLFEYGPTSTYGSTVAAQTLGAADTAVPVGAVAGGLQPQAFYHFRVVALRDGVRYEGGDATFVTGAAPPPTPPPPVAKAASLLGSRLTASRRGRFKVRVAFGATAPLGRARLTVKLRRRDIAKAAFRVRRGQRVAVRMRLSRRGRKAIRPGRTKRVRVVLRLPGGEKVAKTLALKRRR